MKKKQNTPHYFKLREIKTGKVFLAEWSNIAGEWYEKGNGNPHQSEDVEIVDGLRAIID